jgi:hypothetical protein
MHIASTQRVLGRRRFSAECRFGVIVKGLEFM